MAKVVNEEGEVREEKVILASGEELTEEMSEALAEEAERGYDLSNATFVPHGPGRPSLGSFGISPRMSFRVDGELYRAATARAKAEERSISDLAREALATYMGRK